MDKILTKFTCELTFLQLSLKKQQQMNNMNK